MTRYSAPFKVKKPFAETTVLAIDASGNMAVTGNVSANGAANIIGPISSGSAAVKGYAMMVQTTTVVGGTKVNVATLPEGADLIDVKFFVKTAFATAGGTPNLLVGTSAIDNAFLSITNVTALGMHSNGVFVSAGTDWDGLSGAGGTIHAHVTAASGAVASAAVGVTHVLYVHKV